MRRSRRAITSLSLHSGMTFLSQVRPMGVKDKITGWRQRLPRENSLTKDDSPGFWKSLGNLTENRPPQRVEKSSSGSKAR